jgi:hypothetical protein
LANFQFRGAKSIFIIPQKVVQQDRQSFEHHQKDVLPIASYISLFSALFKRRALSAES